MKRQMPLLRYFLYVGAALLALLFISDMYLPKLPVAVTARTDVPIIRIHIKSDRKWPERVVYDTSLPTIVPAQTADADASGSVNAPVKEFSANTQAREAFAQLQPTGPKKPEPNSQRKRKIAKHRAAPLVLVAQRPQIGWFGGSYW
jgi:hypothetical protein